MSSITAISPARSMQLIGRGVFIELLRRKDLYVLLMLMFLFVVSAVSINIVGVEEASTAALILNIGLTLAYIFAHTISLLLALRQIPDELENRTLYPLLAKPLERHHYILGKWLACTVAGASVLIVLTATVWATAPQIGDYYYGLLAQALVLHILSLALLAAMGLMLSLLVPKGVNLALCGLWFLLGSKLSVLLQNSCNGGIFETPCGWFRGYLPDFSKLNLITRFTDGIVPLGSLEVAGLLAYGGIFIAVCLIVAIWTFQRRQI